MSTSTEKKEYQKKIEEKLTRLHEKVHEYSTQAEHVKENVKHEYNKRLEMLRHEITETGIKLKNLRQSDDDEWNDIKEHIDNSIKKLEETANKFFKKK